MTGERGRPSVYRPVLASIVGAPRGEWHVVREGYKTRTAPSGLRSRYPGFDFKAVSNGDGFFTILARVSVEGGEQNGKV